MGQKALTVYFGTHEIGFEFDNNPPHFILLRPFSRSFREKIMQRVLLLPCKQTVIAELKSDFVGLSLDHSDKKSVTMRQQHGFALPDSVKMEKPI
jgi:hypothetical protein